MAPQASRRFHEAGVGSRTGLRLSAVARDQDGFEDLEAFYKASQAALDHQHQPDSHDDDDQDDYDSFDETRFSKRSSSAAANARNRSLASSSSMMDIQTSSAPSPRSLLRSSRASAASTSSPARKGKLPASNITLADDDDDADLDLHNLSTGSRSFDLGAMAGDDEVVSGAQTSRAPPTPNAPARGLSARQAAGPITKKAAAKPKAASTAHRLELSDSEDDDGILASLQERLNSAYNVDDQDMANLSDYDTIPARSSPAKAKGRAPAPNPNPPSRPKAKPAANKRTTVTREEELPIPVSQASRSQPTSSASQAAPSPKRKPGRPPIDDPAEQEPEPGFFIDLDDNGYDELPPPPSSRVPKPTQSPQRKRGRPPTKSRPVDEPHRETIPRSQASQKANSLTNGRAKSKTSQPAANSNSKRKAGEVVEKVRSQPTVATVYNENGVRRSTRQRFAPLEYWRGERIRYGRPSLPSGQAIDDLRRSQRPGEDEFEDDPSIMHVRRRVPVLDIKEVIRVPRAPGEGTFAGSTRPRTTSSRRKVERKSEERTPRPASRTPDAEDAWSQLDPAADTVHVEDGWDAKTVEHGIVIDDEDGGETEASIVRTKASLQPVAAANQQFRFEKLFNCGGIMATGVLQLPPGTRKPTKPSKDNSFVFCVLQGALRATVHRKSFIVGPHGIFQVPAGNTYALENICLRDVHLFFAQCRKTKKANAGDLTTFTQMSDTSYGTPHMAASARVLGGVAGRYGPTAASASVDREQEEEEEEEEEDQESEVEHETAAKRPRVEKVSKAKATKPLPAPALTADSDQEDSEADDFETSRQVKTKKRVLRKL